MTNTPAQWDESNSRKKKNISYKQIFLVDQKHKECSVYETILFSESKT